MSAGPAPALTAESTIGAWLADPRGAAVVQGVAQRAGLDERTLSLLRRVPLARLVAMSGRPDAEEVVASLVAAAHGGPPPTGSPVAGPAWREQISAGRFTGLTAVVTGAASGIGRAVASRIAREGGAVVAVDVTQAGLTALVAELPHAHLRPVTADITSAADCDRVVAACGGRVDALANVAGVLDDFSPVHEVDDEVLRRVFDVNVFGLVRLIRAVVPLMLDAGRGAIVNVASEAALRGSSAGLAYTASKHAVVGVTRSSAFMYEPAGIRVNAVAPGGTLTGMRPRSVNAYGQARVMSHVADVPLAVPEALAATITYLLSDDAANVTGAVLPSDGGESVF